LGGRQTAAPFKPGNRRRVEHQLEAERPAPHGDQIPKRVRPHLVDEGRNDLGDRLPHGPLEPRDAREVAQPFQQGVF